MKLGYFRFSRWCILALVLIGFWKAGRALQVPPDCQGIDYCQISCDGIDGKHTLCSQNLNESASCGSFVIKHKKHLFGFLHAHNSIRNRIANKAKFSGMVRLQEDPNLIKMAENWLKQCKETDIDKCANYNVEAFNEDEEDYKGVSQNVAYIKSKYFPPFIKYYVLRKWYYEKLNMKMPKYNFTYEDPFITWSEKDLSNNFSHLAHPDTSKMGCVLGGYRGGYAIVCNYYKFLLNAKFNYGVAASSCPNSFPLRGLKYKNLCTFESRGGSISYKFNKSTILIILYSTKILINLKTRQCNYF